MAITDIFSRRYKDVPLRDNWTETEIGFMVQAMTMMRNLLWSDSEYEKVSDVTEGTYRLIHDKVAIELAKEHLSQPTYQVSYTTYNFKYPNIIRAFLFQEFPQGGNADAFLKDRLSLIEQAFRHKWEIVQASNSALDEELNKAVVRDIKRGNPYVSKAPPPPPPPPPFTPIGRVGSSMPAAAKAIENLNKTAAKQASSFFQDAIKASNAALNDKWDKAVEELNERLCINGYALHFHNGLLQAGTDDLIEAETHEPFWDLVSDPMFKSVDEQMLEALDRRDNGDRTAPFHALSALESVIKIISKTKGWNTGNEKGAANYIDNLISVRSGRFIEVWEGDMLREIFSGVRNPLGHGPGDANLPKLTPEQTDWTIDTAMAWTKSLIMRM